MVSIININFYTSKHTYRWHIKKPALKTGEIHFIELFPKYS